MTAGVISPVVRIGGLDGASCSTVAKHDCDGIFCLWGMVELSEETELDSDGLLDGTMTMLGCGGEFAMAGSDGAGDKGEDGAELERLSDVSDGREHAVLGCTVFPLLRVRSEEVTDGFRRDSLGYFSPE